jgi:succinyl-diaminopimelate desuccinylase
MPVPKKIIERLMSRITSYRADMVEFQKMLTTLPALSPMNNGQGEWSRARYIISKLQEYGLNDITHHDAPDKRVPEGTRPNIIVHLNGNAPHPAVWVMAHLDVVPPGESKLWFTNPFEGVVKEEKIYGRGTEDNQQGIITSLFAMRALKDEGVQPTTDVYVMLVSDEETGSSYGVDYVLNEEPQLVGKKDIVVVPDAGNSAGSDIEVAEKSILWCALTIKGKQVHASTPQDGINAHRAAANLAVRLDQVLHAEFSSSNQIFDPPQSTFEPTKHEANVQNINTIPGEEKFYFDCRILPNYSVESVMGAIATICRQVEEQFNVAISVAYPQIAPAAPATANDALVVKVLGAAIRQTKGIEPRLIGIGGGTVAALFRRRGIPAAVWSTIDNTAHAPNEYCKIENLVEDAKVFALLFVRD